MKLVEVALSKSDRALIDEFAGKVVKTDVYGFRNGQTDEARRREQHVGSKLAEWGVYRFLTEHGVDCTEPDMTIKRGGRKNWQPDLVADGVPIHVKSQDVKSASKYGLSWMGEKKDVELYGNATGHVALCLVTLSDSTARILAMPSARLLKDGGFFGEPVLEKHREKKFAIYHEKVREVSEDELWSFLRDHPKVVEDGKDVVASSCG